MSNKDKLCFSLNKDCDFFHLILLVKKSEENKSKLFKPEYLKASNCFLLFS
jgi:hypothetical protein